MGKNILINILILVATNGYWYCATQQETIGATPVIMLPIICTIGLAWQLAWYIADSWEE